MLKLSMVTLPADPLPAILFKTLDDFAAVHEDYIHSVCG
jgi:hypothetical protein